MIPDPFELAHLWCPIRPLVPGEKQIWPDIMNVPTKLVFHGSSVF
jgi:hypothetical protein